MTEILPYTQSKEKFVNEAQIKFVHSWEKISKYKDSSKIFNHLRNEHNTKLKM